MEYKEKEECLKKNKTILSKHNKYNFNEDDEECYSKASSKFYSGDLSKSLRDFYYK